MFSRAIQYWADRFARERHEIGRNGDIYLVRYVLVGRRFAKAPAPQLVLHHFLRSDYAGALHDHPWPFKSLIILGGYWEHTADGRRTWYGPGSLLNRPAEWRHRVEIAPGADCWSLLWIGKKERSWGFHCVSGFVPWRQFDDVAGCPE